MIIVGSHVLWEAVQQHTFHRNEGNLACGAHTLLAELVASRSQSFPSNLLSSFSSSQQQHQQQYVLSIDAPRSPAVGTAVHLTPPTGLFPMPVISWM